MSRNGIEIFESLGFAEVELTMGKKAIIDIADISIIAGHRWYAVKSRKTFYARTRIDKFKFVFMHELLMNKPDGMRVDHISMDGLDNRKSNLRVCTHSQNCMNRPMNYDNKSGFKGVYPSNGRWGAKIVKNYKKYYLGLFDSPEQASKAYNSAAVDLFHEFAPKEAKV